MKIIIYGGGSFGTALAHQLSANIENDITILLRDKKIEKEINEKHTNSKYFLNQSINERIKAATDIGIIKEADVVILAIPTKHIENSLHKLKSYLTEETLIVNVAKGIMDGGETIVEFLQRTLNHDNIISFKGGSFAAEMINCTPTLLTIGFDNSKQLDKMHKVIEDTGIYVDYTTDIRGVELLSAIKNIYAILLGNIDAKFNSANTRFLILTKAYSEIKIILTALGGKIETTALSCGIGDLGLTALNDLSRNRTLGLLIGKGFYNSSFEEDSVVLEGIKAIKLIDEIIPSDLRRKLPLLNVVIEFFIYKKENELSLDFKKLFQKNYTTILTYGTFDLLHYGHLEILRRAKQLGDRLIVGLSTDEFNRIKGKECVMPYNKRKQLLEVLSYVDLVIPEEDWEQKVEDIKKHDVDIFVMGSDWKGKFDELNKYCEVKYFPRTKGISTTKLKKIIEE